MNLRVASIVVVSVFSIALYGCATVLTGRGAMVRVEQRSEVIKDCRYLGFVSGSSSLALTESGKAEQAMNEVKNKAAALNANTVFIVSKESMFKGSVVRGKAYSCPGDN